MIKCHEAGRRRNQARPGQEDPRTDRPTPTPVITYPLVIAAGAAFGAGDQYLGSLYWPIATTFSLMSAPWLVLPFCAGCTQLRTSRAAFAGLIVTMAGLAGYIAMITSPIEGVHDLIPRQIFSAIWSQAPYALAGLVTGPIYGYLGQRWRIRRSWVSALLATSPLLLEPATQLLHLRWGVPLAYVAELAVGLLAALYFIAARSRISRLTTPT